MARAKNKMPKHAVTLNVQGRDLVKNDHVYISAPWSIRDGEPYLVGRIVEILQPQPQSSSLATNGGSAPASPSSSTTSATTIAAAAPAERDRTQPRALTGPSTSQLRLRVNYYFRTRDITNRYVADHRVLVASFHTDIVPAEYVRGRCTVMHREHIGDLERYKRMEDTFYWHQLYDRYLHRYFDSVPTYRVKNAPADIVKHLVDNFEFVLCEVGRGEELCDAQRGCCVCFKWAANPESVTCARCSSVFHLTCLDPPLSAKPKAGYGWSCAPCSMAHDEEVEGQAEGASAGLMVGGGRGPPPVRKAAEGGMGGMAGRSAMQGYDPRKPQMLSAKGKGKAREVDANVRSDARDWHMLNGWPFRYFGMHAHAYNVLDPHDSFFPRARTRLGNKFQCVVPEWDSETKQQVKVSGGGGKERVYFQPKRSRASIPAGGEREKWDVREGKKEKEGKEGKEGRRLPKGKQLEILPRGEDEMVQIIWQPKENDDISSETLDTLFEEAKRLKAYRSAGVDLLNRAVQLIRTHEGDVANTIAALRKVALSSMGHASWNEEERRKLAEGAEQYNNDIAEIAEMIPTKRMADVVKRYYIHLGHNRQEDEPTQPEEKAAAATRSARQSNKPTASSVAAAANTAAKRRTRALARVEADELLLEDGGAGGGDSGDESDESICANPTTNAQKRMRFCAVCAADESRRWYFCPENVCELDVKPVPLVMCESCGIRWRHYGAQYPPYGDELKPLPAVQLPSRKEVERAAAEEAREAKLAEEEAAAAASALVAAKPKEPTPPPPKPVVPPKPCLLCKRFEPKTSLFQCDNCTLSVHASCYGLPEGHWPYEEWLCDMCDRAEQHNSLVLHPQCLLCPEPHPIEDRDLPLTALELMKQTELNNYVHLLCAVWHRELLLGDPALVSPVEALPLLPHKRILETCTICGLSETGCTVKCEDCEKHFHVSCAWLSGYKFAFEVKNVKKKRKDDVHVKFKENEGIILPCVWCPDHHFSHAERKTYDLGARDQATKLTALQMYVRTYKTTKFPDAPLPFRQGRRLDSFIEPVLKPKAPTPPPAPIRRSARDSLLSSIIEEMPPPPAPKAPTRTASKRSRKTSTPMKEVVPQYCPDLEQYEQQQQFYAVEPMEEIMPTPMEEDAPLPGKRARKAPKRFEPESPKPKVPAKKRRTGSFVPNDYPSYENGRFSEEPAPPMPSSDPITASFGALPSLPNGLVNGDPNAALPPLPYIPNLPALPTNFTSPSSLPPLPNFPTSSTSSAQQPGAFADAFYPTDIQIQQLLYPSFQGLPVLPQLEQQHQQRQLNEEMGGEGGGDAAVDPALEALSSVATAVAEAKVERPEDAPVEIEEQNGEEEGNEGEQNGNGNEPEKAQPETEGQTAGKPDIEAVQPEADGVDGTNAQTSAVAEEPASAPAQDAPVEANGAEKQEAVQVEQEQQVPPAAAATTTTETSPSIAPPQPVTAPPAAAPNGSGLPQLPPLRPLPQHVAGGSSAPGSPLAVPARYGSPSNFDGTNHPLLGYLRAHEASGLNGGFRVDTPDDSDAASDRFNSPAPSGGDRSGVASPAPFAGTSAGDSNGNAEASTSTSTSTATPAPTNGASSAPPAIAMPSVTAPPPPSALPAPVPAPLPIPPQPLPQPAAPPTATPQAKRRRLSVKGQASPAVCGNCGTSDSSLWRRDDQMRKLCNSCGLYYKTHGHDRPANVIARGIGAARVQKRKAQSYGGEGDNFSPSAGSQTKRQKAQGVPLPLQQAPNFALPTPPPLPVDGNAVAGPSGYGSGLAFGSPYHNTPALPTPPPQVQVQMPSVTSPMNDIAVPQPHPQHHQQQQHSPYNGLPALPELPVLPMPPVLPPPPSSSGQASAAPTTAVETNTNNNGSDAALALYALAAAAGGEVGSSNGGAAQQQQQGQGQEQAQSEQVQGEGQGQQ
ncbi:hypothetical protein JCM8547_000445 [Rhodosporidiobolus lusitaniae]